MIEPWVPANEACQVKILDKHIHALQKANHDLDLVINHFKQHPAQQVNNQDLIKSFQISKQLNTQKTNQLSRQRTKIYQRYLIDYAAL